MRRGCGGGEEGLRLREETGCGRTAPSHKPHEAGVGPEGPPIQQPEPAMSIPRSVAEVLKDHVTLELEGLYLNVYVPKLQHELGVVSFFRFHRGYTFASSALMDPISKAFIARDNGLLACADPARAQAICDGLGADRIDALLRKWLAILPHPFSAEDRQAGYRYEVSILQAEFSLTQALDRPVTGRLFFEEVIRENLDIGRPDQAQLIFARRVTKRTPGRFRTRVITDGVIPSLHIDSKHSRIKQYHKEGRALRTETTINDTRDFGIGKRLSNLPALRRIGFDANRRLLDVQRISQD